MGFDGGKFPTIVGNAKSKIPMAILFYLFRLCCTCGRERWFFFFFGWKFVNARDQYYCAFIILRRSGLEIVFVFIHFNVISKYNPLRPRKHGNTIVNCQYIMEKYYKLFFFFQNEINWTADVCGYRMRNYCNYVFYIVFPLKTNFDSLHSSRIK